jgi:hypothetical protein
MGGSLRHRCNRRRLDAPHLSAIAQVVLAAAFKQAIVLNSSVRSQLGHSRAQKEGLSP